MPRSTTKRMTKPKPAKLTAAEREWIDKMQELLSACPSSRLGFYTIGDPDIFVYDRSRDRQILDYQEQSGRSEFCNAVSEATGGNLATLVFPSSVHSTAG